MRQSKQLGAGLMLASLILIVFRSVRELALQLAFFEVGALSGGLASSTPERPCDDGGGLDPLSGEPDGDATDFLN